MMNSDAFLHVYCTLIVHHYIMKGGALFDIPVEITIDGYPVDEVDPMYDDELHSNMFYEELYYHLEHTIPGSHGWDVYITERPMHIVVKSDSDNLPARIPDLTFEHVSYNEGRDWNNNNTVNQNPQHITVVKFRVDLVRGEGFSNLSNVPNIGNIVIDRNYTDGITFGSFEEGNRALRLQKDNRFVFEPEALETWLKTSPKNPLTNQLVKRSNVEKGTIRFPIANHTGPRRSKAKSRRGGRRRTTTRKTQRRHRG